MMSAYHPSEKDTSEKDTPEKDPSENSDLQGGPKPPALYRRRAFFLMLTFGVLWIAICAISVHGFTLFQWVRDTYSGRIFWQKPGSSGRADAPEKLVALTFDDGPNPNYTPRIATILARYGVHATFFQEGCMVSMYPELTRALQAQGHCIGNHTYSHPCLTRISASQIRREIAEGQEALSTRAGIQSHLFRPPYGEWDDRVYQEAERAHLSIILWSVALEHHEVPTPQQMADRALRLIRPGGILLMHDGTDPPRETTVQALPLVLEGLKRRGYRCVTIPELLALKE